MTGDLTPDTTFTDRTPDSINSITDLQTWKDNSTLRDPPYKDVVRVMDPTYGAAGDGSTDDTAALQAVAAAVANTGKIVDFGNRVYKITSGTVTWSGCHLRGNGTYDTLAADLTDGSTISITYSSGVAFKLAAGTTVSGLKFYYPDQVTSSSPTAYPATLQLTHSSGDQASGVRIYDNLFVNAYIAIDLNESSSDPFNAGYPIIRGNYICAISKGILAQYTSSEHQINDNVFSYTFWRASTSTDVRTYISANAVAITLGDAAGAELAGVAINDNYIYGFNKGIEVSGRCTLLSIANNTIDGTYYCIDFVDQGAPTTCRITGGHFLAADPNDATRLAGSCIRYVTTTTAHAVHLNIVGCLFGATNGEHIVMTSTNATTARVLITGCEFFDPGNAQQPHTADYACIYVDDGSSGWFNVMVANCHFERTTDVANSRMLGIECVAARALHVSNCRFVSEKQSVKLTACNYVSVTNCWSLSGVGSGNDFANTTGASVGTVVSNGCYWSKDTDQDSVAAATDLSLPLSTLGSLMEVTGGSTIINTITASWKNREVTLWFTDAAVPRINFNGTASGNIYLAGDTDLDIITVNSTLRLVCDKTNWYEVSRSIV